MALVTGQYARGTGTNTLESRSDAQVLADIGTDTSGSARPPNTHGANHTDGTDDIDGDQVDIDFTPSNYTPDSSPPEAADVDDLAAHLKGIDTQFNGTTLNADTDVSGNAWVLDEDTLVSDSDTKVATQQSIKAYVDSETAATGRNSRVSSWMGL